MRLLDARVLRDEASCVGRKLPLTGSAEYGSMLTAGHRAIFSFLL